MVSRCVCVRDAVRCAALLHQQRFRGEHLRQHHELQSIVEQLTCQWLSFSCYSNLFSLQKCLKFPEDRGLSEKAVSLMRGLLTDADNRLTFDAIKAHPFFADVDLENIRQGTSQFVSAVCWSISFY